MEVKGLLNCFPSTAEKDGKKFKVFKGSISRNVGTKENPVYKNMNVDVRFTKDYTVDQLNKFKDDECYTIDVQTGYLDFSSWEKDGVTFTKPLIWIAKAEIKGHKAVSKDAKKKNEKTAKPKDNIKDDDLPF